MPDRTRPSAHYARLLAEYRQLHEAGDPRHGIVAAKMFDGRSLRPELLRIREQVERLGARTLLDYGCGKGRVHAGFPLKDADGVREVTTREFWGLESVTLYDPAYPPHAARPEGRFDIVICTDVLEHCPEEDIDWILGELFDYADRLVYATIATYPARKTLPSGENAHCTVRPVEWWAARFAAAQRPGVAWVAIVDTTGVFAPDDPGGRRLGEAVLSG